MPKKKKLLLLFLNMLYISAFTFGGGFVIATFMKKRFVDKYHMVEENEMLDYVAIAQSCPGAIAVNASILTGFRIGGTAGMLLSVLGTVIPPVTILCVISYLYSAFISITWIAVFLKGMQIGVAAVIFDVVYSLAKNVVKSKSVACMGVMCGAFVSAVVLKVNVIAIIISALVIGVIAVLYQRKRGKSE